MSDKPSFRHWLRQRRKEFDLTQEKLAERVGCSVVTIRRIEEGVLRPSRQLAELLAAGFDVPAHERPAFIQWARTDALRSQPPASSSPPVVSTPSADGHATGEVVNPYKGLRAFQEADAPDFFGRETLTVQLLSRLHEGQKNGNSGNRFTRFLAVVGPSGSGKSSVVRAGMIPSLRRSKLPGGAHPLVVDIVPGTHPLEELEAALLRVAVNPPASLLEQLQSDERGLVRAVKRVLPADGDTELLLVLDQFEEIFTLVSDEAARTLLLDNLYTAVTDPSSRLWVITTLRADFYDRPLLYDHSSELLGKRTEAVGPMSPLELHRAIVGPAERVGLTLEADLVLAIQQDVAEQPGTLPLLQYALTELFEHRVGRVMTLAAYRETGGVLGSLARRAEAIYTGLNEAEREEARQTFLRLTTPGEGLEDTRRRVRRIELASAARDEGALDRVLDIFGHYRLVTFDYDPMTHGPTVEVAHEALLRMWPRLRQWLDASRANLRAQRQLHAASTEWAEARRDPSFLASGARLTQFGTLAEGADRTGGVALTHEEQEYLTASEEERDRQEKAEQERQVRELQLQKRAASRLRYLVVGLALFLVIAAVLTVWALIQRQTLEVNLTHSEAQRLASEANTLMQAGQFPETAALLSLRSINTLYTPEGDATLLQAATLQFPIQQFVGPFNHLSNVAMSFDGRYVLTCHSTPDEARLWDAQTGKQLRQFTGHTDGVGSGVFSPDGKYVLTGSADKTVRLWDAQTGKQLRQFLGHNDEVTAVAFSSDGKWVASSSADKTVRLWDAQTGKQLRQFTGHTDRVNSVTFSPDGRWLVTGSNDNTARLWDVQTGQQLRAFEGHTAGVHSAVFSPDGKQVLTGSDDKTARLWDVQTGEELRTFAGYVAGIASPVFSPDGKQILTGSGYMALLLDATSGVEMTRFIGHNGMGTTLFSSDGRYVLTASGDGVARLWAARSQPLVLKLAPAGPDLRFSSNSRMLLMGGDNIARLWDVKTGTVLRQFVGHTQGVGGVAFSPDDKMVATSSPDNTVRLWDAQTGKEMKRFTFDYGFQRIAISPDGRWLLSPSLHGDNNSHVFDLQNGQEVRTFTGHTGQVWFAAYSPDSKLAVTASVDKTAKLWDTASGKEVRTLSGHTATVDSAVFSPDGKMVLTASDDGTARIWDVQTGQEIRRFIGHAGQVWNAVFSSDGRWIVTGGDDNTVRIWDVQTGQEVRHLVGHTGGIETAAISPDSKYVASASDDGTARLWPTDYHEVVRYVCALVPRDFTDEERAQYNILDTKPTCPQH